MKGSVDVRKQHLRKCRSYVVSPAIRRVRIHLPTVELEFLLYLRASPCSVTDPEALATISRALLARRSAPSLQVADSAVKATWRPCLAVQIGVIARSTNGDRRWCRTASRFVKEGALLERCRRSGMAEAEADFVPVTKQCIRQRIGAAGRGRALVRIA